MRSQLSFLLKTPWFLGVFFIALFSSASWAQTTPVTKKVLAILVDIEDGSGTVYRIPTQCDDNQNRMADILFGSQNDFKFNTDQCLREASYGKMRIGGATYPGTSADVIRVKIKDTIPDLTTHDCGTKRPEHKNYATSFVWADAADEAARAQGKTVTPEYTRIYVIPQQTKCGVGFSGCGNLGCRVWAKPGPKGCFNQLEANFLHELGHHLTRADGRPLAHAAADYNNDGVQDHSYGDHSDFMGTGGGWTPTSNALNRIQLGWLDAARVKDGSAGGTFTVSTLDEKMSSGTQVVKLVPGPAVRPYYLSYRTKVGCLTNASSTPAATINGYNFYNQLQIHRDAWEPLAPTNHWQWEGSFFVASLEDGESFTDKANGYIIKQISHTEKTVTFSVTKTGAPAPAPVPAPAPTPTPTPTPAGCVRNTPTLALSPTYIAVNATPVNRSFQLKVTNKDSAGCPSSTFPLDFSQRANGWTSTLGADSITLAPGTSRTVSVNVGTSTRVPEGEYYFRVGTEASATHASVTRPGRFIVDYTAPAAPANLKVSVLSNGATLTWSAATDGTGSGAYRYKIYRNGTQIAERSSPTYSDWSGRGTRTYAVRAVDRAGNISAPSADVTVNTP